MTLSENWDLRIDPDVFKALKNIPQHDTEAILAVIKLLPTNPYFGDVQKMKGQDHTWRRRVGNYRIFYKILIDLKIILVFRLERRTSKTY
ncbi:MAG: hypothetical protein A3B10_00145 [Candidatus Doudnabacteria bacterium RIFCSPLOWO2_01_FULL_44_21]|uniref:Plasmid stabilization protein n=1 Tax=Candidatus Doudnabacteria bacterium RIFCSPLOWO2_01_FULL_44_21 TaxID=1817841 RepID=A0A1F5PXA3_9BACT|nr:MAG: hypothetical protein A3B95_03600 [Candidatus Doudnabacteria bacterium RIFCSPHIGHO2_02_FULL_43_13b]OGE94558.1 MAG: hypothetical protein A3B10_00145 [Candidatus Doudnabacteria bacterium RIFCSPLOWO2_01_FULL_44_21]